MAKTEVQPNSAFVLGSGSREHAITWALLCRSEGAVSHVYVLGSNAAFEQMPRVTPLDCEPTAENAIRFAADYRDKIGLTVPGSETWTVKDAIVDRFMGENLPILGPTQPAAQLEGSKGWAQTHIFPKLGKFAPEGAAFTDPASAMYYLRAKNWTRSVVKADGLASGKGVIVADTYEQADQAILAMIRDRLFKEAGKSIVLQKRYEGEEVSVIGVADGTRNAKGEPNIAYLGYSLPADKGNPKLAYCPITADRKRLLDNDLGPNTGGMGAWGPVPISFEEMREIHKGVMVPTLNAMMDMGIPYKGVLYAGLMRTSEGYKVLEFNTRFGDPETQIIVRLLSKKGNFFEALRSAAVGALDPKQLVFLTKEKAMGVVLATQGYAVDEKPRSGDVLELPLAPGIVNFHGATRLEEGKVITKPGRVVTVTSSGTDFAVAAKRVYQYISNDVRGEGIQYRTDVVPAKFLSK